jgi:hypothetical protein
LIDQSRAAIDRSVSDGDLDQAKADSLNAGFDAAEASLTIEGLSTAASHLLAVCNAL